MNRLAQPTTGLGSIGAHYTRYATGNVLTLVAGFVSFPILSRTLSNYEFGVIGYMDTILVLIVATLKFGLSDALLRFYPHGEGEPALRRFFASILLVPLTAAVAIWGFLMAGLVLSVALGWVTHGAAALLALAGIPLTVFASYVQRVMGAQERSMINALTDTSGRWLQALLVIVLILTLTPTASSVYLGRLLAAVVMAVWMGWWLSGQTRLRFADADLDLTRAALIYALPLALNEITQILYGFADRLILKAVLRDLETVGIYAIGSSLALYVSMLVTTALRQSYTPVLNRLYIQHGASAVIAFKKQILEPMTFVIVLLVAGLLLVGRDFFIVIAGAGKHASAPIFVMMSATFAASTLFGIAGYGALLTKRTGLLLTASLVAVVVKVGLNFLLIPLTGVMGTVYATMFGEVAYATGLYLTCPPALRCLPAARVVMQSVSLVIPAFTAAWVALHAMPTYTPLMRLAVGGSLVLMLYLVPLLVLLPQLREFVQGILSSRR